ncbi:WYL domain-containing protein [Actinomadura sp. NPDC047616]|uniref:helix-turn-helix transcriptional regulator n=1 Tax=Actinomadura sp. NPDC047616 TaxID=3155914 RepID=UPI0033EEE515
MTDTSARLLRLLSLLQTRREWTGPELAERLGISVRTVRRDVERLRELGYPVHATLGSVGGYRLEAGAAMPPLLLDDEEAVAIALGLGAAAGGAVEGIEDATVRALAKLEQVLPERLRRRVSALHAVTVPIDGPPAGPTVAPETLTVLAAACRDHERLRFSYRAPNTDKGAGEGGAGDADEGGGSVDASGSVEVAGSVEAGDGRLVEPHGLVSAGRRWYLLAWDVDRAAWRTFRVDRMRAPRAVGVRFAPREVPGGDAAQFVRRSLAASRPTARAVLRVHAPAHVLADRFRVTGQELEPVDERTCLLRTRVESLEWTALRVAFLELDFEVVEPPELADRLRDLGRRLQRAAGPPPLPPSPSRPSTGPA